MARSTHTQFIGKAMLLRVDALATVGALPDDHCPAPESVGCNTLESFTF